MSALAVVEEKQALAFLAKAVTVTRHLVGSRCASLTSSSELADALRVMGADGVPPSVFVGARARGRLGVGDRRAGPPATPAQSAQGAFSTPAHPDRIDLRRRRAYPGMLASGPTASCLSNQRSRDGQQRLAPRHPDSAIWGMDAVLARSVCSIFRWRGSVSAHPGMRHGCLGATLYTYRFARSADRSGREVHGLRPGRPRTTRTPAPVIVGKDRTQ